MKLIILLALVGAVCACAHTPAMHAPSPPSLLARADLLADAEVLERTYTALHPGLYRYNTPAQMRRHFSDLRHALDHDQTLADAYLAFSVFAATVRCGHTYANFYNQPKAIRDALFLASNRVPFFFRWIDGRMIVTENFSDDSSLVAGSQIESIDGIRATRILNRLTSVARADGANDAKRIAWLQVQGEDSFEAFDIFLPLFFPQIGTTQTLLVRGPGEHRERTVRVKALSYAERIEHRPARTEGDGPLWTLDLSSPEMAILRMPTWALYNSTWDWKRYLKEAFESLARAAIPNLVIDLRANEGGEDVGDEILAHLIDSDLQIAGYQQLVRYRKVPDDLSAYLDTWDNTFKDWGDAAVPFDERFYRLTRWQADAAGATVQPQAPRYRGHVFVLVGPTNSSATFEFADAISHARLGTLVGRPTGGNQRGINGGAFFFLRLPHSKIELDVPLVGQFATSATPDAGLMPEVETHVTIDDIVAGRDVDLATVRKLLKRE